MAGLSKAFKYWGGRSWQTVVNIPNIGMAAAIPCHQIPPPLTSLLNFGKLESVQTKLS